MKKSFIITGEYSGDIHAAKVVSELKKLNSEITVEAVGGQNLLAQGVKLFSTHDKMSAMGLTPKIIIDHISLGKRLVNYLTKEYKPDLVLLVDYGTFNLNISKLLHKAGIKTYFYIWHTQKDSKVRSSHAHLDGTIHSIDEDIFPGEEYGCRCWAEEIIGED